MPLAPRTIVAEQYLIHRIDGTNQYGLQWDVQHSLAQAYVLYILYSLFKAMHYYSTTWIDPSLTKPTWHPMQMLPNEIMVDVDVDTEEVDKPAKKPELDRMATRTKQQSQCGQ